MPCVTEAGGGPTREHLFTFEAVGVDTPEGPVLDGIDLRVPLAGITVLVGPSGSGKSTLLRLCNRLEAPTRGHVFFRGHDLATLDPLVHRRRVGMVFQQPTPFGGTVRDNLRVAAPEADEAAMRQAMDRAHLGAEFLDRRAGELSRGESQRTCLARALIVGPEVLLMDEPTSALDETASRALEHLGRTLADAGVPVIWVTHDLDQARRLADCVVTLEAGRITGVAAAPPRGEHAAG
jgi:putative ABC transport system ATP-binding protein